MHAAALVLVVLGFSVLHILALPIQRPLADRSQYLAYAYNLLQYGTFSWSRSGRGSPQPDLRREPGYPIVLAAAMLLHPGIDLDRDDVQCIANGTDECIISITWLLVVNVACMALTALLVFHAINLLTGRAWLGWIGLLWLLVSGAYGLYGRQFFSEALAGLLIMLLSLALWRLLTFEASRRACLKTGLLLGALVLTKASFYYFLPPLAVGLALILWKTFGLTGREAVVRSGFLAAGVLVLVLPWQVRNMISVGTLTITGRSGLVLAQRANVNDIAKDHFLELLAYYSPSGSPPARYLRKYRDPEFMKWYQGPDGPMLPPYRRQAEFSQSIDVRRAALKRALSEEMVGREALHRIAANPMLHLRATPLIAYRGVMSELGYGFVIPVDLIDDDTVIGETLGEHFNIVNLRSLQIRSSFGSSVILFVSALVAFPWCLVTRRWALVFLMAPAAFLFAFYSLVSPFVGRFSVPIFPMLIVVALLSVSVIADKLVAGYRALRTSLAA